MCRDAELADLCNSPHQPIKLRKLLSSDPSPVDHIPTQEQLIEQVTVLGIKVFSPQ
jgi:hypothetical protein